MKKISKQQVKDWIKKYKTEIALGVVGTVTAGLTAIIVHQTKKENKEYVLPMPETELDYGEDLTAKFYNEAGELKGEVKCCELFMNQIIDESE